MKSSVGGKERGPENELVHWCHGAPGESQIFVNFLLFDNQTLFKDGSHCCVRRKLSRKSFELTINY